MSHTRDWNESLPAGSDVISHGDDEIRATKLDIRERMAVDHIWNDSTTTDGYHKKVTLKEQSSDPTTLTDYGILYTKDVNGITELFYKDSAGNIKQLTTSGKLNISLNEGLFRSGDMLLSSNTTAPTGWTDVSATYENKFIRISSGTPLTTGGADTHSHGVGTYASANHTHTLDVGKKGGDLSDGVQSDGTYMWNEGADTYYSNTVKITTVSGGGGAITGTSASADNVPAYIQLRIYKKD